MGCKSTIMRYVRCKVLVAHAALPRVKRSHCTYPKSSYDAATEHLQRGYLDELHPARVS